MEEGMKVEANYKGKGRYYKGKIARDNRDGTFDITYDDGDKEYAKREADIRSLEDARPTSPSRGGGSRLEEGMKVEARYRGRSRYYPGRIRRENRDGTFDVDYDDGEKEMGVIEDYIRALEDTRPTSPSRGGGSRLEEGMKVEARYRGRSRYYPGKIRRENRDGTFDIDYDDGEKEMGVAEELIRPLERELSSTSEFRGTTSVRSGYTAERPAGGISTTSRFNSGAIAPSRPVGGMSGRPGVRGRGGASTP